MQQQKDPSLAHYETAYNICQSQALWYRQKARDYDFRMPEEHILNLEDTAAALARQYGFQEARPPSREQTNNALEFFTLRAANCNVEAVKKIGRDGLPELPERESFASLAREAAKAVRLKAILMHYLWRLEGTGEAPDTQ